MQAFPGPADARSFLWNFVSGWRVSAFKIGYPVGLADVLEEGLRTINEQRWRHKKQSLTRRPSR